MLQQPGPGPQLGPARTWLARLLLLGARRRKARSPVCCGDTAPAPQLISAGNNIIATVVIAATLRHAPPRTVDYVADILQKQLIVWRLTAGVNKFATMMQC